MPDNATRRGHNHPIFRVVLIFILMLCGSMLVVSINWIFHKIHDSAGAELAEVTAVFLSIFVLALILVGMRAGLGLDRWIRHRKFEECRHYYSSKYIHRALSWLGYGHLVLEGEAAPEESESRNLDELMVLLEKPKRGGRRPAHPLERWVRVVLAWENRDTLRNTITLPESLCQEFGTNADGTPRESESNFYDYRRKILKELHETAKNR
ncbi:MAG: hypothetical protein AB1554_01480 [Chloroflexota bacterium]